MPQTAKHQFVFFAAFFLACLLPACKLASDVNRLMDFEVEEKPYRFETFTVVKNDTSENLFKSSKSTGENSFEADKNLKDDLKKLGFVKITKDGTQQDAYAAGEATRQQLIDAVNAVNSFYAKSVDKLDQKGNLCIVNPDTSSSGWGAPQVISYTVLYAEKIGFVPPTN